MKLYHSPHAPNPRRVRMFLAEKGLEVPLVPVDLNASENRSPDYLAKNPLGLLPALELDDGRILNESMAICRYFEELHPTPVLFGTGAWERATIEQWSRHAELEMLVPIALAFQNLSKFWIGRLPQAKDFGDIAQARARDRLNWFNGVLADRPFLAGEHFSVADITLFCAVSFGRVADVRIGTEHANLKRWFDVVSARPSAKA